MKIIIEKLEIPFKQSFSHASAKRQMTEAVIVKAESESGLIGYGEGCPRYYVTNETIETAYSFFDKHKVDFAEIKSLEQLKQWACQNQSLINKNPAAYCAVELSLLDLFAKQKQHSVELLLSLPQLSGTFQYTAVLGAEGLTDFTKQLQRYCNIGFNDYKIKISGDLEKDKKKVDALRELGSGIRVRLDANNLWNDAEQVVSYIEALNYSFLLSKSR